jgi:hypothetical protein
VSAAAPTGGITSYFIGNDPSKWRTGIPHYSIVRYQNAYPGIDLEFYNNSEGNLEFDFVVRPKADPSQIELEFAGYDGMSSKGGDLLIRVAGRSIRLRKPLVYQESASGRREVAGSYRRAAANLVKFDIGEYDPELPLVIDPVIVFSTFLGGAGLDEARAVTLDSQNNIYVTGRTASPAFLIVPDSQLLTGQRGGASDVFVAKLNPAASALLYLAIMGGAGEDSSADIAFMQGGSPGSDSVFITGGTSSSNFPTTVGSVHPAPYTTAPFTFAVRLNSTGTALDYSTYLGEAGTGTGIAVDMTRYAYISLNEGAAASVRVLNDSGSAVVRSYGPFEGVAFNDLVVSSGPNGSGWVTVVGDNRGSGSPITAVNAYQSQSAGGRDAIVMSLNPTFGVSMATYLGGSGDDSATGIDGLSIVGTTTSTNLFAGGANGPQTTLGGGQDGFFLSFRSTCLFDCPVELLYSTYLGGSGDDSIRSVKGGFVTGTTSSTDFPIKDAVQSAYGGGSSDAFIAAFAPYVKDAAKSFVFSSFLGGAGNEVGYSVAGTLVVGSTTSSEFPLVSALQPVPAGGADGFVTRYTEPVFPMGCLAQAAGVPVVRASGRTELFGEPIILCNSGVAGTPRLVTLQVTANVPITSRILNSNNSASEALLFVDEPVATNFVVQPAGVVVPGANVFQGVQTAPNTVTFANIPIAEPGTVKDLVFRITNLRGDVSGQVIPPGFGFHVSASISETGLGSLLNPVNIVAEARAGANAVTRSGDGISAFSPLSTGCGGHKATVTAGTAPDLVVRFDELIPGAFRNRSQANTVDPATPPSNQNVLGLPFQTESGLYHSSFPTTNSLNLAGLAASGTRLMLRFTGVPAGVKIWVTSSHFSVDSPPPFGSGGPLARGFRTTADANGAGAYNIIPATVGPYSQVQVSNGTGIAVWEIAGTATTTLERIAFGVAFSAPAGSAIPGKIRLEAMLAPITDVAVNLLTTPRFVRLSHLVGDPLIMTIGGCAPASRVGTYNSGQWRLDVSGNGAFDPGSDRDFFLGWPGATRVIGDWNGDGRTKAGIYNEGFWFLDYDGNTVWDGGVNDKLIGWGLGGALPFTGDWNGDGKTKIGVYSNGFWFLDYNGDFLWDAGVVDKQIGWGWAGVTPFVGDWNGDGKTKIGVYSNGFWFLDYNGDYLWDPNGVDKQIGFGWAGVTPILGDWNGDGRTKIGVYSGGYWYIDYDGNYQWTYPANDRIWEMGWGGTTPVIGDWNGDGKAKPGAFFAGFWYLDFNGNGTFDGAVSDRILAFGQTGDTPVVGRW